MMRTLLATMIVVLMAGAGVANAEISAQWVVNPGCTIRGYTTYDLEITTDAEWTNARLELTLTSGTIYQDPGFDQEYPQTGLLGFVPALEWDSFFSAPDYKVPGFATKEGDGWTDTSVMRSWFDSVDTGPGTFVGARITVSDGAEGPCSILLFDNSNPGVAFDLSGHLVYGLSGGPENLTAAEGAEVVITQVEDPADPPAEVVITQVEDPTDPPAEVVITQVEDPTDPPAEDNTGDLHDPLPDYLNPLTVSYIMDPPPPLPEPGTMVLVSLGFLGMPAEDNTGNSHDPFPDYLNPLTGSYNMGPPPPLPEPGTMVLVSLGFLGMLIRRGPRADQSQG